MIPLNKYWIGLRSLCTAVGFKSCVLDSSHSGNVKLGLLPLAVISILLLIGGIELNPGPTHVCNYCQMAFTSTSEFWQHSVSHKSTKNFINRCCFDGCAVHVSSLASLKMHVSRYHVHEKEKCEPSRVFLSCPLDTCNIPISSRQDYLQHMVVHIKNNPKCSFTCAYEGCMTKCYQVYQFRVHMARYHSSCDDPSTSSISDDMVQFLQDDDGDSGSMTSSNLDEASSTGVTALVPGIDLYPPALIKDELAKFYLKLEAVSALPTSTVQSISEEVRLASELSHHCLKNALREKLAEIGLDDDAIKSVIRKTFQSDPVFNVHHKEGDAENLSTNYMRVKYWKENFPYVEPSEVYLGEDHSGKKCHAHHISIKESLSVLLRNQRVKEAVLQSFTKNRNPEILSDFTDGLAYEAHKCQHGGGKCIQIIMFQDAFDPNAFGASTSHKTVGFYFSLGNLPPEYRTKLDLILLTYLVKEKYLNATLEEEVAGIDKWKSALKPVLEELETLKREGIEFEGEGVPVCLLFLLGDSLGQHQIGRYVTNFSTVHYFCRFCPMSRAEFLENPHETKAPRSKEDYDRAVKVSLSLWRLRRKQYIEAQQKARQSAQSSAVSVPSGSLQQKQKKIKRDLSCSISHSNFLKLKAIHTMGVKYHPSPLNSETLGFHVTSNSQPPCLAHDLFEGIVKRVLCEILKYFVEVQGWFTLSTLNLRIKAFKCKGSDALDTPKPLKCFDTLSGNACENWTLLRLLPLIIGDLIADKEDPMWKLYLSLKNICEFVCAPRISLDQVGYLKSLIDLYLCNVKKHLPKCLTPKHHFLAHYPYLITVYGPLIRMFTLRFESKHMFFKRVARACRNFTNFTYTLARNYSCLFAYDHSADILPEDLQFQTEKIESSLEKIFSSLPDFKKDAFSDIANIKECQVLKSATLYGTDYNKGYYMVLGCDPESMVDLEVGLIDLILLQQSSELLLLLEKKTAVNTFNGYFHIEKRESSNYVLVSIRHLPDLYPLPSYDIHGVKCLALKHSVVSAF